MASTWAFTEINSIVRVNSLLFIVVQGKTLKNVSPVLGCNSTASVKPCEDSRVCGGQVFEKHIHCLREVKRCFQRLDRDGQKRPWAEFTCGHDSDCNAPTVKAKSSQFKGSSVTLWRSVKPVTKSLFKLLWEITPKWSDTSGHVDSISSTDTDRAAVQIKGYWFLSCGKRKVVFSFLVNIITPTLILRYSTGKKIKNWAD